jgi:signal transduction histidine kinase
MEEVELVQLVGRMASEFDEPLEIDVKGPSPFVVNVDPDLLGIAVRNSLTNAAEHPGVKRVVLTWGTLDDEVWLSVIDDGPGFPADVLASSESVVVSTKDFARGFGIKNMRIALRSMGGRVEIANHSGGGGRVRFVWPLQGRRG